MSKYPVKMNTLYPSELSHSLSFLPCYSTGFIGRRIWLFIMCQLFFCIVSSIVLFCVLYKRLCTSQIKSWKRAVEIMKPVLKRLQNLEKERIIWNSYVEWIEDYCSVYYGLLNYINWTVSDLDKLYRDRSRTLRSFSEGSVHTLQSDLCTSKAGENPGEGVLTSEVSLDKVPSDDEDSQFFANFSRAFANMKLKKAERSGRGDEKIESGDISAPSTDVMSTVETNDESGRDDSDGLHTVSDVEDKFSEDEQSDMVSSSSFGKKISKISHETVHELEKNDEEKKLSINNSSLTFWRKMSLRAMSYLKRYPMVKRGLM